MTTIALTAAEDGSRGEGGRTRFGKAKMHYHFRRFSARGHCAMTTLSTRAPTSEQISQVQTSECGKREEDLQSSKGKITCGCHTKTVKSRASNP
mmetsp:Transcript_2128/g.2781  ORF Transcript_2128/g.2781 Transcript_2128/m.2781 type:complete len:94 (-) Transcript_2128:191-472(-)